jgi:DinB superfamily
MNHDLQGSDLSTVLAELSLVTDETRRAFGALSAEQVNWKASEAEWSIGQCFDHLIISNRPYVQIFDEILADQRTRRLWERMPFFPRLFGTLLINTLRLDLDGRPRPGRLSTPRAAKFLPRSSRPFSSSKSG